MTTLPPAALPQFRGAGFGEHGRLDEIKGRGATVKVSEGVL